MFKINAENNIYTVIPTAEYLLDNFDRLSFPYDSNWEIYKLFNYEPMELFQYISAAFNGRVRIYQEFPYATIEFLEYSDAESFKNELEKRATAADKNI